jgi:uncharacterized protein YpmS
MNLREFIGHGGGKIKCKSIMAILLLSAIILPFSAGTAFATTNITNGTSNQTNPITNHNLTNVTNLTKITTANTTSTVKAAGSPASVSFTSKQINTAATTVTNFVQTNQRLPNYVTIANTEVTMPQFLQLITANLLDINKGLTTPITIKTVQSPSDPPETVKNGNILESNYLNLAQSIQKTINSTGTAPNSLNTSLGILNFQNTIYTFSKILNFQNTNQRLPNYVSVTPWKTASTNTTTSNVQSILNAIGTAEAKFADVQGQSSPSVMAQCGYGDCWADSGWLYEQLTAKGIETRIMEASNPSGIYYLHRWVEINIGNGWVVWDYAKYNSQHYGELGDGPFVVEEGG